PRAAVPVVADERADVHRPDRRHGRLHGPRADHQLPRGSPPSRPVRPRRDALLPPDRPEDLRLPPGPRSPVPDDSPGRADPDPDPSPRRPEEVGRYHPPLVEPRARGSVPRG